MPFVPDTFSFRDASGNVVERYVYTPYGAVTVLTPSWAARGTSSYNWIYFFQGKRYDAATGLYDSRERAYSPTLMRPLQADPLGLVPGNNDYEWENDGPMDAADPSGLAEQPSIPIPAPWQPKPTELPPVPFGGLLLFPGVEFHAGQWLPDQFTLRGYGSLYFQDLLEFKFSQPLGYEYPELVFDYKNWLFGGNEESPLIVLDGYYKSLEDAHVNLGVKWDESHSFRLDYTSCGDEDILYTGGKWKTDYADLFFTFDYSFRNLNYKTVWNVGASKEFETPWGPFSYFIAASGDKGFG